MTTKKGEYARNQGKKRESRIRTEGKQRGREKGNFGGNLISFLLPTYILARAKMLLHFVHRPASDPELI